MARERLPNRRESSIYRIEHVTPEGGGFELEVAVAPGPLRIGRR